MTKKLILGALLALGCLTALAGVRQSQISGTASTNATATILGTSSTPGYFRRLVITTPKFLTNLVVTIVDVDGSSLWTTNLDILAGTNGTVTSTYSTNILHGSYVIKSNGMFPRNTANSVSNTVTFTILEDY
jgi:hypothetical protein